MSGLREWANNLGNVSWSARYGSAIRHLLRSTRSCRYPALVLTLLAALAAGARPAAAATVPCTGGDLPKQDLTLSAALDNAVRQGKDSQPDLLVTGTCIVKAATPYYFGNVNIIKPGILVFQEADATAAPADKVTSFWAKSIIIENGGTVLAGTGTYKDTGGTDVTLKAFGSNGGRLDIVLYGEDQSPPAGTNPGPPGVSAPCASPATDGAGNALGPCGIPATTWNDNGNSILTLGNGVQDRFYQYGPLFLDGKIDSGKTGYFGYKSIGLSYGGTLLMRGLKGTSLADDTKRDQSGSSWVRLAADAGGETGKQTSVLTLDRKVVPDSGTDWQVGDEVVVTTTDFLATHSEKVTIKTIVAPTQIEVTPALQFPHVGHRYDLATHFQNASDTFKTAMKANDVDPDDPTATNPSLLQSAETRAAVALLNRSIRIMSGGDRAGETLDDATNGNTQKGVTSNPSYQFGGHMIFRQGFQKLQMQGVELRQLGVGGRLAHYPAHFHMARKTPADTFIKDSAVNESMTRWFVLHSTLGVTLQRNVGWMSIGHGYFLEDGTETDNRLFGNIGIFARPAIIAPFNPRNIPGILAWNKAGSDMMFRSDAANPTIFWITNGYNDFAGNLAVGAGACGACFWLHAVAANTDMVDVPTGGDGMQHQKWDIPGVRHSDRPGMFSPLRSFFRNSCSTAMLSFMTVSNYQDCTMVSDAAATADAFTMTPVLSYAPQPGTDVANKLMYYPLLGGQRIASDCPGDQPDCVADVCNSLGAWCATTVLDHYTSSFNYAEINFSAIWLRAQGWFLYDHSFLSDVLGGGLSAVAGGDYSRTSSPSGYWNMASHSVFVGATQTQKGDSTGTYNPYADTRGPHVPADKATGSSNLACKLDKAATMCISAADGLGFFLENFNVGQRMFNIYDGPAYEDGNAYVNIRTAACPEANADGTVDCMYGKVIGVRKYTDSDTNASPPRQKGDAYLANAAIGWKQPNGFYYPPAFHSSNLFFSGVDIRHYVISPLFIRGKYQNDGTAQHEQYATDAASIFGGFTDIDRQTVLNDDDGSLTGFKGTLSINDDPFYAAPVQVAECGSNPGIGPANACLSTELKRPAPPGARSSPYEYVTTVIYPECGAKPPAGDGAGSGACGSVVVPPPGFTEDPAAVKSTRHLTQDGRGGDWSKSCDGPHCFGVPIYRQNLTNSSASGTGTPAREWEKWTSYGCVANPADPKCDFPFIRMNGAAMWQRSTLTVNNNVYYIDSTRPKMTTNGRPGQVDSPDLGRPAVHGESNVECSLQPDKTFDCFPRSVNVFQPKQWYDVFFVFATKNLKQTYQIYVGDTFDVDKDITGVLMIADDVHFTATPVTVDLKQQQGLTVQMVKGAQSTTADVLQVTVDLSQLKIAERPGYSLDPLTPAKRPELCKPASLCKWNDGGTDCTCNIAATSSDPRLALNPKFVDVCNTACSGWARKQLDCPDDGCFGFRFRMPDTFVADNSYKRPKPTPYPNTSTNWATALQAVDQSVAGAACYYTAQTTPALGASSQCQVPNIADLDGLPLQ